MSVVKKPVQRLVTFEELPDWLNPDQVGQYLGLSRSTTYEMLRRKSIPSKRYGRRLIIPKIALAPDRVATNSSG